MTKTDTGERDQAEPKTTIRKPSTYCARDRAVASCAPVVTQARPPRRDSIRSASCCCETPGCADTTTWASRRAGERAHVLGECGDSEARGPSVGPQVHDDADQPQRALGLRSADDGAALGSPTSKPYWAAGSRCT